MQNIDNNGVDIIIMVLYHSIILYNHANTLLPSTPLFFLLLINRNFMVEWQVILYLLKKSYSCNVSSMQLAKGLCPMWEGIGLQQTGSSFLGALARSECRHMFNRQIFLNSFLSASFRFLQLLFKVIHSIIYDLLASWA